VTYLRTLCWNFTGVAEEAYDAYKTIWTPGCVLNLDLSNTKQECCPIDGGLLKNWTQVFRIANQESCPLYRVIWSKLKPGLPKEKAGILSTLSLPSANSAIQVMKWQCGICVCCVCLRTNGKLSAWRFKFI